jgi:hypothetical protein
VLARLDQELAPLRSVVDREGTLLRLHGPDSGADLAARVARTVEEMGYVAERGDGVPQVARWFGAAEADELSQEEAHVLAQRWVADLASARVIAQPHLLIEPLRETLLETFRSAARTGAVGEIQINYGALRSVLDEAECSALRRFIDQKLMRPDSA